MKTLSCSEVQNLLARGEPLPSADVADAVAVHLADCTRCGVLDNTIRESIGVFRKATEASAQWAPSFQAVRDAAVERGSVSGIGVWWKPASVLMVALVVAVWLYPRSEVVDGGGINAPNDLRVEDVHGLASQYGRDSEVASLVKNARLSEGAVVTTGPASQLVAKQAGIASWSLLADSMVHIVTWSEQRVALGLERGEIRLHVDKLEVGETFEIRTEYCTVTVVGTAFTVHHRPGIQTEVSVVSGVVRVDSIAQGVRFVHAGETVVVTKTERFVAKTPLPDSPAAELSESEVLEGQDDSVVVLRRDIDASQYPQERREGERTHHHAVEKPTLSPREANPETFVPETTTVNKSETDPPQQRTEGELLRIGRTLLSKGDDKQAITLLETAVNDGLGTPRLLGLLADAHRLSGDTGAAKAAYQQAFVASGTAVSPQLLVDFATLCEQRDEAEEAAQMWEKLLSTNPTHHKVPAALAALAKRAEQSGDPVLARRLRADLCGRFPEASECTKGFVSTGRYFLNKRDWEEAERHFGSQIQSSNQALKEAAFVGLIRTKLGKGNVDEARMLLKTMDNVVTNSTRIEEISAIRESLGDP